MNIRPIAVICSLTLAGLACMNTAYSKPDSNEKWLGGIVAEAKTISRGSSKVSFEKVFEEIPATIKDVETDKNSPSQWDNFRLKKCKLITSSVQFGYAGTQFPEKPHEDITGPVVVAISPLHLNYPLNHSKDSAKLSDRENWLNQMNDDVQSLKSGMTLSDLSKHFSPDAGLNTIPASRYVHNGCNMVKVDVQFDSAGIKLKSISPAYVDMPVYD